MSEEEEEVGGAGAGDLAASGEKEEASGESPERTLRFSQLRWFLFQGFWTRRERRNRRLRLSDKRYHW